MTKRLCIYHTADNDGRCSAAIVKRKYPDIKLVGWDYGLPIPWSEIAKVDEVILVDLTLQPHENMIKLSKEKKLVWIDHHASSVKCYNNNNILGTIVFEKGIGACVVTWGHYFPDEEIPYGVQLLGEHDVWNHENKDTLPFEYGLRAHNVDPESTIWPAIFRNQTANGISVPTNIIDMLVREGQIILKYVESNFEYLAKEYAYEKEIDGFKFLVANNPHRTSQYFDAIWDEDKYDGVLSYFWNGLTWKVSIYSAKDNIDLSVLAEKYGGGGHKKAAGFETKDISWLTRGDGRWAQHGTKNDGRIKNNY
jgi:oligoribonuclease NrnB/cAMP/cGMP phosphodiesterase (DHH superfamily)